MKRLICVGGLLLLVVHPPLAAQRGPATLDAALKEVDARLAADLQKDGGGGVSVGVVIGGKLVWTKNYGFADVEAQRAATSDTDYRIGSLTKRFTSLMLLQLVDQGKVGLTDPLERYVPEVKSVQNARDGSPPITLLQVATMTSGLAREPGCANHSVGPVSEWQKKILACLPETKYQFEPGTQFLYSNIGYATLGLALERAAGQPYIDYVAQHIFKPLGMARTSFEPTAEVRENLAHGYVRSRGTPVTFDRKGPDAELAGRGYRVPNGAVFSTVNDLAKFVAWELGEGPAGLLKKETQNAVYSRAYSATDAPKDLTMSEGYGLGLMIRRRGELVFLGHDGVTGGFTSAVFVHRPSRAGVIILHNSGSGPFNQFDEAYMVLETIVPVIHEH
jgi:CubicO group peptidase (beta-lactamase class C family)